MQDGKHVILCVDDDADILEAARLILESNGFAFAGASSAEEALKLYDQVTPDILLVDLMMEEVDAGTSLVKELKLKGTGLSVLRVQSKMSALATACRTSAGRHLPWKTIVLSTSVPALPKWARDCSLFAFNSPLRRPAYGPLSSAFPPTQHSNQLVGNFLQNLLMQGCLNQVNHNRFRYLHQQLLNLFP